MKDALYAALSIVTRHESWCVTTREETRDRTGKLIQQSTGLKHNSKSVIQDLNV